MLDVSEAVEAEPMDLDAAFAAPGSENQSIDALECPIASAARRRADGWVRLEESGRSCSKPLKK